MNLAILTGGKELNQHVNGPQRSSNNYPQSIEYTSAINRLFSFPLLPACLFGIRGLKTG